MRQEPHQILRTPFSFLFRFLTGRKSLEAFLVAGGIVAILDQVFEASIFLLYTQWLTEVFNLNSSVFEQIDLGYAPVLWNLLLGFMIGTLVIVISFAAQNIPKLIDLYMEEWSSLFFIWFIIVGAIHVLIIKLFKEAGTSRDSSVFLNIHLLSFVGFFTFPYTFRILKSTKTQNVINLILNQIASLITQVSNSHRFLAPRVPHQFFRVQQSLFDLMNQLADLLDFVPFKEPKANIIQGIGELLSQYVERKSRMAPGFFLIAPEIREDISFKTLESQIDEIEKSKTFYEQKGMRLIGNAYQTFLETDQFELSTLCTAQLSQIGSSAVKQNDQAVIELIMIRFNTHFRSALKHGQRYNEPRNLYNLAFYYGQFIQILVEANSIENAKTCFGYLKFYSAECFKIALNSSPFAFILDTIAAEMSKILMLVHQQRWQLENQETLLNDFLSVDNPGGVARTEVAEFLITKNSVRVVQIGLGLYYLKHKQEDFALKVIQDTLQDLELMEKPQFINLMQSVFNRLRFSGPTFWEDTDRGNLNIYYTPHADQIEKFQQLQLQKLESIQPA